MKRHLTELSVQRFRVPKTGQTEVFDLGYPGLALRIGNGGAKTFVVFHRHGGKLNRLTLGRWPEVSLGAAREGWRKAREAIARGEDPAAKNGKSTGDLFEVVVEDWLRKDIGTTHRAGAARQVGLMVDHDLIPAWKGRPVDSINKADVIVLMDGILARAPAVAARVYAMVRRFFAWCEGRDIISNDPSAKIQKPPAVESRDRVLSDAELAKVWKACGEDHYGRIFRLLALTGLRREQIGRLRWSEIQGDEIHLEGERTKNGDPHIVPLSKAALEVLQSAPHIGDEFVFTIDGDKPVNDWARAKEAIDATGGVTNWRTHDLRRTLASGMQRLGIAEQVIEAVLGHTSGRRKGIVRVYQRHDFAKEKREALERWGEHVMGLVA
jgi:integrase